MKKMKLSVQRLLILLIISSIGVLMFLIWRFPLSSLAVHQKYHQLINSGSRFKKNKDLKIKSTSTYPKKWVVITSIFNPTQAINVFSKMPNWQLLVVGDKKTPSNWSHPKVIYLGVEEQEKLPYEILRYTPWNRYTRKTIGYLYAIQNGAEYIYESDDDNVPNQLLTLFPQPHPYRLIVSTTDIIFNPYAHFGQSSTWPRGYPLDMIGMPVPRNYTNCPTNPPTIIQSLVNGDPDMDAIFRLTRKHSTARIDINFDKLAPLYIHPKGTYSPFNSQNTLFHRKSFWGLVFPISVTNRATDIYRSYWTQKLMWMIGQRLAFGPATFYHMRSGHNLLNDFDQEKELYKYVGKFIQTLDKWSCSTSVFSECMLEATRFLVDGKFWTEDDYNVIKAWISDLTKLDRSLVDFAISQSSDECVGKNYFQLVFFPNEQKTSLPHHPFIGMPPFATNEEAILNKFTSWCNFTITPFWSLIKKSDKKLSDIALVVSIYDQTEKILPIYESYFTLFFEKIVYCVISRPSNRFIEKWKPTLIFFEKTSLSAVACMSSVSLMNMKIKGLLHLGHMMWLNVRQKLFDKDLNSVWLPDINPIDLKTSPICDADNFVCIKPNLGIFDEISTSPLILGNKSLLVNFENSSSSIKKLVGSFISVANQFKSKTNHFVPTSFTMYIPAKEFPVLQALKKITDGNGWGYMNLFAPVLFDIFSENDHEILTTYDPEKSLDSDYYYRLDIFTRTKIYRLCKMIRTKVEHFKLV